MLRQLDLYNFGQFSNATFEFTPGVNVIVGNNGAGKSTVFNGIYGAITGDWSRFSTVKQAADKVIYWHAKPDDRAGTRLHLSNDWVMERNIRPNSRKLTIPGLEKPITKDGEIEKKFQELFGASNQVLRDYVIVQQEETKSVLTMTAQDRLKMLMNAFQLERFEKIWDALDKESSGDRVILAEPRPDVETLQRQLDKATADLAQFEALPPLVVPLINLDEVNKLIYAYEGRGKLENDIQQSRQEYEACDKVAATAATMVANMQQEVDQFQTYIHTHQDEINGFAQHIKAWDASRQVVESIANGERALAQADQSHAALAPPAVWDGQPRSVMESDLANAEANRNILQGPAQLSQTLRKLGSATCPTCKQVISVGIDTNAEAAWQAACDKVEAIKKEIRRYDIHASAQQQFNVNFAGSQQRKAAIEDRLLQDRQRLSQMGVMDDATIVAFRTAVQTFESAVFQLNSKKTTLKVAETSKLNDENSARQARERYGRLMHQYQTLPTQPQYYTAKTALSEYETAVAEDMRRKTSKSYVDRAVIDARTALESSNAYLESRAKRKVWVDRSNILREAFHRNNVPRRVLARRLQGLQAATKDFLGNFVTPFEPVFTDEMDIVCQFNDGKTMPVSVLSTGQKVALALSFRLAQHKAVAPGVDFLCLDEPADGLDKRNRQQLNLMLPTLREISQQNNIQFLIITHDEIPEGIVDNVIRIRDQA